MARPIRSLEKGKIEERAGRSVGLLDKKGRTYIHSRSKAPTPTLVPNAWTKKTGRAATMIESFYHAFHGIWVGLKEERNVRIHCASVVLVIALGAWLRVDQVSWIALTLAMGLVLVAEFLNTSLEHLVNISAAGEYHRSARYAKDTAAAAVLVASLAAAAIGGFVFVPRLLLLIH